MNKSDQIDQLASEFSKFQGEIKDVLKDKNGYGYRYADLCQVLEISRPLLSKYDLSVMQLPVSNSDKVGIETLIMHKSGQWISSSVEIPLVASKGMTIAQAMGSIITYIRRYALTSMLGVAQTDNDGADNGFGNGHKEPSASESLIQSLYSMISTEEDQKWVGDCLKKANVSKISELSEEKIVKIMEALDKRKGG